MIVKISGSGKSFSGLAQYLTHDGEKAQTAERVAWTHTHNLSNSHVSSAVDEMVWTARDAEILKQEAGVRAGGRATEHPAKHISLNWAIEDNPSDRHMVATGEQFLRSMGWNEQQAIFVAHSDKKYKHMHLLINEVHPETGLKLNDDFEKVRAQEWAAHYERERGVIRCEQRMTRPEEREKAMPRNMWVAFKQNEQEFLKSEELQRQNSAEVFENPKNAEWKILKDFQKQERIAFFAQGKSEFKELRAEIYREVREEFRERWANYYEMRKNGADAESLAETKSRLVADQKAVLEPKRDAACNALRESRDGRHRELLDLQKEQRAELRWRQEAGLDNAPFLSALEERKIAGQETRLGFRQAAHEVAVAQEPAQIERSRKEGVHEESSSPARDVGLGKPAGHAAYTVAHTLFMAFLGEAPPPPMSAEEKETLFREAAENTTKQHQQRARDEDDERWRSQQKALYRE